MELFGSPGDDEGFCAGCCCFEAPAVLLEAVVPFNPGTAVCFNLEAPILVLGAPGAGGEGTKKVWAGGGFSSRIGKCGGKEGESEGSMSKRTPLSTLQTVAQKVIPPSSSVLSFLAVRGFMISFLSISSSCWLKTSFALGPPPVGALGLAPAKAAAEAAVAAPFLSSVPGGTAAPEVEAALARRLILVELFWRARCFLIRWAVAVARRNPLTEFPPHKTREAQMNRSP